MANRTFQEKQLSLVKRLVKLYVTVSVGGGGAVTLKKRTYTAMGSGGTAATSSLTSAPTTGVGYAVGDAVGVRSVARADTGKWTVTLSDSYQYLLGVVLALTSNTTGVATAAQVGIVSGSTTPTTNTAVGNGGVVTVQFVDFAGAAVDPASGDTIVLELTLGDASEP